MSPTCVWPRMTPSLTTEDTSTAVCPPVISVLYIEKDFFRVDQYGDQSRHWKMPWSSALLCDTLFEIYRHGNYLDCGISLVVWPPNKVRVLLWHSL